MAVLATSQHTKMPQYYATNDLQCWFRACIDDHFVSLESNDDRAYFFERLSTMEGLREFCDESVEDIVDKRGNKSFVEALMNSVDWEELFNDVSNDMEEEKKAMIDENDESWEKEQKFMKDMMASVTRGATECGATEDNLAKNMEALDALRNIVKANPSLIEVSPCPKN